MGELTSGPYAHEKMMAEQTMERSLHFQAAAIWPKERLLFEAKGLHRQRRIGDLGCGTGEISSRLAESYAGGEIVGLDLLPASVDLARNRFGHLTNLNFQVGDVTASPFADNYFDLTLNRHMLQVVPDPIKVIREMSRITKPGGTLYFLSEDYGMLHCSGAMVEPFWYDCYRATLKRGTDLFIGRKTVWLLRHIGLRRVQVDYVSLDNLNTDPTLLQGMFQNWKDGYAAFLAEQTGRSVGEIRENFDAMIETALDPNEYVVWHVPIITAVNA